MAAAASVEVEPGAELETGAELGIGAELETRAGFEAEAGLEIGVELDAEETWKEEQRMPESESGAGFALGPFRVVLGAAAHAQVERRGQAEIEQPVEVAGFG